MENNTDITNEFNVDGLSSGNENLITDTGASAEDTPIELETFDGISDLIENDDLDTTEEVDTKDDASSKEDTTDTTDNNSDSTPYQDIVQHFQSKGLIGDLSEYEDDDFKFDGSEESFNELMERKSYNDAIEILEKQILPTLPASAKKQIELMLKEDLTSNDADELGTKIANYSELSKDVFEKDVEKAKAIYTEYLKSKGFDDDEISDMVTKAVDLEEIVDKAEKARTKLLESTNSEIKKRQEKAKAEEQRLAEENKKRLDSMKTSISAFREQINKNGFPINEKIIDEIFKSRTEIAGYTEDKKPLNKIGLLSSKDPEGFQNALHLLTALDYFSLDKSGKIKPNFEKISKTANAKAVKKMGDNIEKIAQKFTPVGSKNNSTDSEDDGDVLNNLKQIFE